MVVIVTVCVAFVALFVVVFGALQCCEERKRGTTKRKHIYRELMSTSDESDNDDVTFALRGNTDYVSVSVTRPNGSNGVFSQTQLPLKQADPK